MQSLSIRITQRAEIAGRTVEKSIDIEEIPTAEVLTGFGGTATSLAANDGVPRRIRIAADGSRLPDGATGTAHVAVLDEATGLMWSVESLGDPDAPDDGIAQEHCMERCRDLRLLGYDDWRLPTRAELASLIDDTRHEPAIDTGLFPRVKPRWHWTSTAAAWSSASAWGVYFDDGGVDYNLRGNGGFALAVRRAGQ